MVIVGKYVGIIWNHWNYSFWSSFFFQIFWLLGLLGWSSGLSFVGQLLQKEVKRGTPGNGWGRWGRSEERWQFLTQLATPNVLVTRKWVMDFWAEKKGCGKTPMRNEQLKSQSLTSIRNAMPDEKHFLVDWLWIWNFLWHCSRPMTVPVRSKLFVIHGSSVELHLPIFVSRFKGRAFNRPPGWPGDDANDDPCQVQQVSAGGRRGQGWKVANLVFLTWWRFIRFFFLWPKRHQWWFHECFERQNHESFENESNSVMTHEPLRELTYWLQESALSLHPVSKFLSLQEEEDLQAPRRTGSGLDNVSVGQQNPQMNRYEDGPKSLGDRSQRFC